MKVLEQRRGAQAASGPVRAAEYVRMSTDGQQYSIPRQQAAIREYAEQHGLTVVRTFADPGRSGLLLKNRPGLIQLLDEVQHGSPDFDVILVYDVSRWGRFQDTDESGFYEYLCRRAGVRVEYCVELFQNDGGPLSAILKNIKRIMAAEYSREQSARVHRSICQAALRGHFTGGSPTYGMRRVLVSAAHGAQQVLSRGERRALRQDYIVYAPGPADEVRTVRRIFKMYAEQKLPTRMIANRLNSEGVLNRLGRPWRRENIYALLRNEIYVGTQVYNRNSRKRIHQGPRKKNDPSAWIRKPNAFPAVISRELFDAAQVRLKANAKTMHTEQSLLDHLRELWRVHGYLSVTLVREVAKPDSIVYQRWFGGMTKAYEKIGYVQTRDKRDMRWWHRMHPIAVALREELVACLRRRGVSVIYDRRHQCVRADDSTTFTVRALAYWPTPVLREPGWRLVLRGFKHPTFTVLARMDENDARPLDFLALPAEVMNFSYSRLRERFFRMHRLYRSATLEEAADQIARAARHMAGSH